jgi:hypothetical protein
MDQRSDTRQMAIYLAAIGIVACVMAAGVTIWWNAQHDGPAPSTAAPMVDDGSTRQEQPSPAPAPAPAPAP